MKTRQTKKGEKHFNIKQEKVNKKNKNKKKSNKNKTKKKLEEDIMRNLSSCRRNPKGDGRKGPGQKRS